MGVLKTLSVFSFGLYSLVGVGVMVGLYLLLDGVTCAESWIKRQPMPTDRVIVFVVVAGLAGFCEGSLVQGLAGIREECATVGQMPKPCLLKRLGRTTSARYRLHRRRAFKAFAGFAHVYREAPPAKKNRP